MIKIILWITYISGLLSLPILFFANVLSYDDHNFVGTLFYYFGLWNYYAYFENKPMMVGYAHVPNDASSRTRLYSLIFNIFIMFAGLDIAFGLWIYE